MNVRQIVIEHLKKIGADGLCADECGCGIDDLFPCGNPDIDECKPAKRHDCDGTCGCFWDGLSSDCYRPIDTQNEPEETHL